MSKGCKVALIIFGILAVLVIAAIIVGLFYCEKIGVALLDKMVDAVEMKVIKDLPAGFDEEQVKSTFDGFRSALKRGALTESGGAAQLQRLGEEVQRAMEDEKIDADELERILRSMREISSRVKE